MSIHAITVGKVVNGKDRKFVLLNNGLVCGDRLFKGNDAKNPNGQWPFGNKDGWMYFTKKPDANIAAGKLQTYLDIREKVLRTKKGR